MPDSISFIEHPSDIIAHAATLIAEGRRFALVTSIKIEGGAAREVGSLALVEDSGAMVGYLSNGCIDRDIQFHAQSALASGEVALVRYGNGSRFADLKLPCGGALSVLIDPTPDTDALLHAHQQFADRKSVVLRFQPPEGTQEVSFTYTPKFRIVLAGRGAVFRAIAQVARSSGFQVHALSPDEDDIAAINEISDAKPVHLTSPYNETPLDMLDGHSAFLTLFHDHDWEPALIRSALSTPAAFIGCLGSRRTHDLRLAGLMASGVAQQDLDRVRGPIGLVPSLREAPLIAISAMAEITAQLPTGIRTTVPNKNQQGPDITNIALRA